MSWPQRTHLSFRPGPNLHGKVIKTKWILRISTQTRTDRLSNPRAGLPLPPQTRSSPGQARHHPDQIESQEDQKILKINNNRSISSLFHVELMNISYLQRIYRANNAWVKYFFELLYFFKLKHFNWKNSYPSFQLFIKYMHCGSECFCQMILPLILIGQYLHRGRLIGCSVPVLLAAPSNLPIQVLILPSSPVQLRVHRLSLIILME